MAELGADLKVDAIHTAYGLSQVLFGVSLEVQAGECIALIGRGGVRPMIDRMVVVLPTPLRPISAMHSPACTSSETPNRTWLSP